MTEVQLGDLMKPFGTPTTMNIARNKATGESRGFGFVEFDKASEANAAVAALNGKEVGGQVLKVNESQPPRGPRPAQN